MEDFIADRIRKAARNGNVAALKSYLAMRDMHGGSLESSMRHNEYAPAPAAWQAAHGGHTDCLRLLFDAGASKNATGWRGSSLASAAAERGHVKALSFLIEAGCSIDSRDDKRMAPTSLAAKNGPAQCLRLLLSKGAKIDGLDAQGLTLACHAARRGQAECLAILIAAGCSLEPLLKKNSRGSPASKASDKIPAWIKGECRDLLEAALSAEECNAQSSRPTPTKTSP